MKQSTVWCPRVRRNVAVSSCPPGASPPQLHPRHEFLRPLWTLRGGRLDFILLARRGGAGANCAGDHLASHYHLHVHRHQVRRGECVGRGAVTGGIVNDPFILHFGCFVPHAMTVGVVTVRFLFNSPTFISIFTRGTVP